VKTFANMPSFADLVKDKIVELEGQGSDDAFFVGDLGDIVRKFVKWKQLLPRVEPFYAVKCNQDEQVVQLLADLGVGFDCASKAEIAHVMKMGVSSDRIIYANPCKQKSFLKYAAKQNVDLMTFDNEAELVKIKDLYPSARLVLRLLPTSQFKVQCELGNKFGCHPDNVCKLLARAQALDLNVTGISFHVGSGVEEAAAFSCAVKQAHDAWCLAEEFGFDMTLLDIGGGFPGQKSAPVTFAEIAEKLNEALDKYFPQDSEYESSLSQAATLWLLHLHWLSTSLPRELWLGMCLRITPTQTVCQMVTTSRMLAITMSPPTCTTSTMVSMDLSIHSCTTMPMWRPKFLRMAKSSHPACGVPPVTAWTVSWRIVACQRWRWDSGSTSMTWEPTPCVLGPPSTGCPGHSATTTAVLNCGTK